MTTETDDVALRLLIALGRILRTLRREAPTWLGPAAVSTLDTLQREGPMRPSDLAAKEGVQPPTMTRIVATLEQEGYAVRTPDPSDGRACLVRSTESGDALLRGAGAKRSRILRARIEAMPEADRQVLIRAAALLETLGEPSAKE
jgi:DNA-binding MarR family transcriptional regulator